jgi:hypothetical protein
MCSAEQTLAARFASLSLYAATPSKCQLVLLAVHSTPTRLQICSTPPNAKFEHEASNCRLSVRSNLISVVCNGKEAAAGC